MATGSLPKFLSTPESFSSHLEEQFADLENNGKGDAFLEFAVRLMPHCDFWDGFSKPKKSQKKTHDKGVDFEATSENGAFRFCGQSKYRIREVAEFDQVISKFRNYESGAGTGQLSLVSAAAVGKPEMRFVLVTSSNLDGIISRYEQASLPSKADYQKYRAAGRFQVLDGPKMLALLQALYRRTYLLAPQVRIELAAQLIKMHECYISVVTGKTLRALHTEHGSSLFFENIREFLGTSANASGKREGVNDEIAQTLQSSPDRMLGRNNGVTMKAESVVVEGENVLVLSGCSIVNGCQTTMSIVEAGERADSANVLVKVVAGDDSWDVAKAANYQNSVSRIELDLARFLRPQLVTKMATDVGYGVANNEQKNVSGVLEAVHVQKVSYDSMKLLYLGIFSRFPNNLFESNYSELRLDVLNCFYQDGRSEHLMRVLFQLLQGMDRAATGLQKRFEGDEYASIFARFFQETKPQYRCLLALLAACGCTEETLLNKPPQTTEGYKMVDRFVRKIEVVLTAYPEVFDRVFMRSFVALAGKIMDSGTDGTPEEIAQKMSREVNGYAGPKFANLLGKLRLEMKSDDYLVANPPDFSEIKL